MLPAERVSAGSFVRHGSRAVIKNASRIEPLDEPKNWGHAAMAGVDAILTDYPLELRAALQRKMSSP